MNCVRGDKLSAADSFLRRPSAGGLFDRLTSPPVDWNEGFLQTSLSPPPPPPPPVHPPLPAPPPLFPAARTEVQSVPLYLGEAPGQCLLGWYDTVLRNGFVVSAQFRAAR